MRKQILGLAVAAALMGFPGALLRAADPAPPAAGDAAAKDKDKEQAEVPVKQVVLFSSGVGYFEHFGTVNGNGTTELRFKTQQINDMLKILVLQDLDGGKVTTITYRQPGPDRQDAPQLPGRHHRQPVAGRSAQPASRGEGDGHAIGAKRSRGTILGVEKKQKPVGEGKQRDAR